MDVYEKYAHGSLLQNRYIKVADISEGSYGVVTLAKDTARHDCLVAVKYIYPMLYLRNKHLRELSVKTGRATSSPAKLRSQVPAENGQPESVKEEFEREIGIHRILGLDHPNITTLIDHFDTCLVLEYCARGDLYEALQSDLGPATSQDIKDAFLQILGALSYCHGKSVYHRDLKPENILISQDWSIKICDWGLATTQKIVTNKAEFDVGSERYMAPELFDPDLEQYDASKLDLWSVGVILLTLVFHKNPFSVANYTDKRFLQFLANREALFDFFSTMSGEMFDALRNCLTLDPGNRDLSNLITSIENLRFFTVDEEYWAERSESEEEEEEEEETEASESMEVKKFEGLDKPGNNKPLFLAQKHGVAFAEPATATSSSSDDLPHNRRADALLNSSVVPIPIGGRIRNTRKPFGVALYKLGAVESPYGPRSIGRLRREEFFTPKSAYSHFLERWEPSDSDKDKEREKDRRRRGGRQGRQTWKRAPRRKPRRKRRERASSHGQNGHNGPIGPIGPIGQNGQNGQNDHQFHNFHTQAHVSHQAASHLASQPAHSLHRNHSNQHSMGHLTLGLLLSRQNVISSFASLALAHPQFRTPFSPKLNPPDSQMSGSVGKYVPPFLRLPRKLPPPLHEEFDDLDLNDDAGIFQLEEDFALELSAGGQREGSSSSRPGCAKDVANPSRYLRRMSVPKSEDIASLSPKYVPPFRRGSHVGVQTNHKRRSTQSPMPQASLVPRDVWDSDWNT